MTPYPKHKYLRSEKYKSWLREKRCAVCGAYPPSEVMHQRVLGHGGTGIKPPDNESLPGCSKCHKIEQQHGYMRLWEEQSLITFRTKYDLKDHIKTLCEGYFKLWISSKK